MDPVRELSDELFGKNRQPDAVRELSDELFGRTTEKGGLEPSMLSDRVEEAHSRAPAVDISRAQTLPQLTDPQTVTEMVRTLERSGTIMPMALPRHPFAEEVAATGRAAYADYMRREGFDAVQGLGVEQAKRDLRQAFVKFQVLRDAELTGLERLNLTSAAIKRLVNDQVGRALDQAQAAGVTPGQNDLTAIAGVVGQWTPAELDEVYKLSKALNRPEPKNEFDERLFKDYLPFRGKIGQAIAQSAVDRLQKFTDRPESARMPPEHRLALLQTVLGDDASRKILDEYERQKVPYLMGKLGLAPTPTGGLQAAYSPDSYSFVPLDTHGALRLLTEAKARAGDPVTLAKTDPRRVPTIEEAVFGNADKWAAAGGITKPGAFGYTGRPALAQGKEEKLQPSDLTAEFVDSFPEEKARVVDLYRNGGVLAVNGYLRQVLPQYVEWAANRLATLASMPPQSEKALTPFEQKAAGPVALGLNELLSGLGRVFVQFPTNVAKDLDAALGKVPAIRKYGQEVVLAGTNNPELARSIETPAEAFKYLFRSMVDRGQLAPEVGRFLPVAMKNDPALKDVTDPATVKAVLDLTANPLTIYQEGHTRGYEQLGTDLEELNAQITGRRPFSPVKFLATLGRAGGHMFTQGLVEPLVMVTDDPTTAAGLLVSAKAATMTNTALRLGATGAFNRVMGGLRLRDNLIQLSRHAPEWAERLRTATGTALKEALARGDDPSITRNLEAAHAVARVAAEDFKYGGRVGDVRGVAGMTARVWPFVSEKLGTLGATVMDNIANRSTIERLRGFWTNLTGKSPKLDKFLSVQLGQEASEVSAAALKSILTTEADSQVFAGAVNSFVRAMGREPTKEELISLMPERFATMAGLLQAADQVGEGTNVFSAFIRRVFGNRPVEVAVPQARALIYEAADSARRTVALRQEFGVKQIPNQILLDVIRAKVEARAEHADYLERGLTALRAHATTQREAALIEKELASVKGVKEQSNSRLGMIRVALQELRSHDYTKPWKLVQKDILDELDPETLNLLLQSNLAKYFSTMAREKWFDFVRGPAPEAEMGAARKKVTAVEGRLRQYDDAIARTREQPIRFDGPMNDLGNRIKTAKSIQAVNAKKGLVDPDLDQRVKDMMKAMSARSQELADGTAEPSTLGPLMEARELVIQEHRQALSALRSLEQGTERAVIRPGAIDDLLRSIEFKGASKEALTGIRSVEELRDHITGAKALGLQGNPFTLAHLPASQLAHSVHELVRTSALRTAAAELRSEDFFAVLNRMTPDDRLILAKAQLSGKALPKALAEKYPDLKNLTAEGKLADDYFFGESKLHAQMTALLQSHGRFSPEFVDSLRDIGYDPHEFLMNERPGLIAEPEARRAMEGATAEPYRIMKMGMRIGGEEWMFQRDFRKWRVRVNEPETVVNERFGSKAEAIQFLQKQYGSRVTEGLAEHGDDVTGTTPYGHNFVVAAPWNAKQLAALRPVVGTPELRMKHITQSIKDAHISMLTDALNLYGTRVIDEAAYRDLMKQYGTKAMAQFVAMPKDPAQVGALAGKYVHRSVVAEMNRASATFDSLNALLEGVRSAYLESGNKVPRFLAKTVTSGFRTAYDAATQAARANLITYSPRTWVANLAFNVMLDHIAGGPSAYSTRNLPNLLLAIKELIPSLKGPTGTIERHPWFLEAREEGLVTGLHAEENTAYRRAMLRITGLTEKSAAELEAELQKLHGLEGRLVEAAQQGTPIMEQGQIRKEIAAVEAALREANKTRMERAGRFMTSFWYRTRDAFGLGENKLAEFTRRMYNMIDEHYKLAKYFALRDAGATREAATQTLRLFSQQYADIPAYLRNLPFQSLVVAFPYELARLTWNAMTHRPANFVGLLSVIPALNFVQLAQAGIDWDRFMAALDQRGNKNPLEQALAMMTNLYTVNPETNDIESELDFGSFLPYMDTVIGRGPVAHGFQILFPPEKRTVLQSLGAATGGYLGAFMFNHPLISGAMSFFTGRDPNTGQPYVDDTATAGDRIGLTLKNMAQVLVPAGLWGTGEALLAPSVTSRKTGRAYKAQEPSTRLIRAWTGIGVKGQAAHVANYALGIGPRRTVPLTGDNDLLLDIMYRVSRMANSRGELPDYPIYSKDREERELYYASIENAKTPEERARYQAELDKLIQRQTELDFAGFKGKMSTTERQTEMERRAIQEEGVLNFFTRLPIHAQALVLAYAGSAGVHDRALKDLAVTMTTSNNGRPRELNDPDAVQQAVDTLKAYLDQDPRHSIRIRSVYNHLLSITLPESRANRTLEQIKDPMAELREKLIKEALRR